MSISIIKFLLEYSVSVLKNFRLLSTETFVHKTTFITATSKTWIKTLDLDPEKPGPRKTWTLKNLDPKKPGP